MSIQSVLILKVNLKMAFTRKYAPQGAPRVASGPAQEPATAAAKEPVTHIFV